MSLRTANNVLYFLAQIWHTCPQKAAGLTMNQQQIRSQELFNYQSLINVACGGVSNHLAFVMRRSSVRFWLWASILHPNEYELFRVFCFFIVRTFKHAWHTLGTLDYNRLPKTAAFRFFVTDRFVSFHNGSKSYQILFECAAIVPFSSFLTIFPSKNTIKASHIQCDVVNFLRFIYTYSQFLKE